VLEKNEESHKSDGDDSSTSCSRRSSSDSDDTSSSSSSSSSSDEENPDSNIKNEQSAPRKKREKKVEPPVVMTEALQRAISSVKDMKRLFASYFLSDLYLQFPTIFSSLNTNKQEKKPQYKFEICSGAGEWVVTQAKNDPTNVWGSLEFRYDRVYKTFSKMIFDEVPNNLCVMAGDAKLVVPRYMSPGSFDWIFVNHPEPPQQTGGRDDSEAAHLLDLVSLELIMHYFLIFYWYGTESGL
jgi:hypothetical protein